MEIEKEKELEQAQASAVNNDHDPIESVADLPEGEDTNEESLDDDDHKHIDYSNFTKVQFVELVKDLSKDSNYKKIDAVLKEIKPLYDDIREKEKAEARARFIEQGGVVEDFEFKGDEHDNSFDANLKLLRDRRTQYYRQLEEQKQDNLSKKQSLIEQLRQLLDSPESSTQFETFKDVQKEWKALGPVPPPQAKTIWANYHALVDRFYDNQSIYFELKELDRRKNLEAKLELCARAERLASVEIIKDAIRELNELHNEFKHLGPVPREDKEAVWQRFKEASDAVYARRDEYLKKLQVDLQGNLEGKVKLAEEVQEYANYQSDRIKEWNEKTKIILDLQKKWEVVGGLPRAKAKEVNKKFWGAFKAFFNNKNNFFKKLDEEREANLKLKAELIQKAIDLKESSDWEKTSNELKLLQTRWKEIGPVPEKMREKIFKEFKDACDYFFEHRREQHSKQDQEQGENLALKQAIFEEFNSHIANGTATVDILNDLQRRFNEIGFVPRKDINAIRNRYHELVDKFIHSIAHLTEDEKSRVSLENQLQDLKNDPMADRKIFQREQAIRKKITKIENDVSLWKNNLEFFARSANAESLRTEFNEKIKEATGHLKELKDQLRLLRQA